MNYTTSCLASCTLLLALPIASHAQNANSLSLNSIKLSDNFQRVKAENKQDPDWATFASDKGNVLFLATGTLLPLVTDGKEGKDHALRTADALVCATALASGLKLLTHEKRPNGSDSMSFPSGHATAAFAVATMQAHYHPKQALLWYGGAAIIGASRVTLDEHYWHDVAAGAALGYLTARFELKQKKGLLLRPFIKEQEPGNRVTGLSFNGSF